MKRLITISFGIMLILVSGCETIIEMDMPQKPSKLVSNGVINPDSTFMVTVSKSLMILDNAEISRVENADVRVYENGMEVEQLVHSENGIYEGLKYPVTGTEYEIRISAAEFDSIFAKDIIPDTVLITSMDTNTIQQDGYPYFEITLTLNDRIDQTDYYQAGIHIEYYDYIFDDNWNVIDSIKRFSFVGGEINDPAYEEAPFMSGGILFSDEYFNGMNYSLRLMIPSNYFKDEFSNELYYDKVFVVIRKVSYNYYQYFLTYNKYQDVSGNPFAQPVQVFNSYTNGYGLFGAYSSSTLEVKLTE